MQRFPRLFVLTGSIGLLLGGCSHNYALHFARESIGHVHCEDAPEMIVHSWDKDPNTGLWSWGVACGAHRYKCYDGEYGAKCTDMQPKPASEARVASQQEDDK